MASTPDAAAIAAAFPEAVAAAQQLRQAFGSSVRILYARNQSGEEIKAAGFNPKTEYPFNL